MAKFKLRFIIRRTDCPDLMTKYSLYFLSLMVTLIVFALGNSLIEYTNCPQSGITYPEKK